MSKKCRAYNESKLDFEPADNRKAFYAGWEAAIQMVSEAVAAEREACAQACEDLIGTRAMAKHCADAIRARQQAAWAEKPKMRRTTREEKIVNPGVYEVPDGFECPRCGHCCRVDWVGLTDHEISEWWWAVTGELPEDSCIVDFARAIEAKLKEKNT